MWTKLLESLLFAKYCNFNYKLSILNSFELNTDFTYELEHGSKLSFLDELFRRTGKNISTTVSRKATKNYIHFNWSAFAPFSCRRGTLETLIERPYLICSTDKLRNRKLKYIEKAFYESNCYSKYVIKDVLQQMSEEHNQKTVFNWKRMHAGFSL